MEKLVRPTYEKAPVDDFFKKMQKEVQESVLGNPKIQRRSGIKSFFLLAAYIGFYCCILAFGNHTSLLFLFYILLCFSMFTLSIIAFHDAVLGPVCRKK